MSKFQTLFFITLCLGNLNLMAQPMSIGQVRDQFFVMDKTKEGAINLYNSLENTDLSNDPVLLAYRGASLAASAGLVSGVWKKLEYFNRGKSELEKAVSLKPLDSEIRFLRFATQLNAPGFLGYSHDIRRDKAFILKTLSSMSSDQANAYLYLRICRFMQFKADLDESEKNTVNQLVESFKTKK